MINKNSKKCQVTIFIIIGLIIVVALILSYMIWKTPLSFLAKEVDPQSYLSACIGKPLEQIEANLLAENGYPNKTDNYIVYYGKKIPYLCKAAQFYTPCTVQEPMLIEHFRKEIQSAIENDTIRCFNELEKSLEKTGHSVIETGNKSFQVKFEKRKIILEFDRKINTEKAGESRGYDSFSVSMQSPIYKLVDTARTVVNYETAICEFNSVGWARQFRDISIKKFMTGENTRIYTLTDKASGKQLAFATKSCVLPAGI